MSNCFHELYLNLCYYDCADLTNKGVNSRAKYATQVQQQRPESPTVTLTWHEVPLVEFMYLAFTRMPGESYTVGDLRLCCRACVAYIGHELTPLFVDSAGALWASLCFRFVQI